MITITTSTNYTHDWKKAAPITTNNDEEYRKYVNIVTYSLLLNLYDFIFSSFSMYSNTKIRFAQVLKTASILS